MQETPPKKRKLTRKEKKFVATYVDEQNGTLAAYKSYDVKSKTVAASIAAENLRKPHIIEAVDRQIKSLKDALFDVGVTPEKISDKVNVLLEAVTSTGEVDYNAVNNGLKHATNIYGVIDPQESKPQGNTYNFIFSAEAQEKIKIVDAQIKDLLRKKHD